MENRKGRIDTAYTILSGDDRADRACKRIPDSSCTNLPLNYVLNVVNGTASKLAEQVASAKVALPWLLSALAHRRRWLDFCCHCTRLERCFRNCSYPGK